jgi:hypothetical protein
MHFGMIPLKLAMLFNGSSLTLDRLSVTKDVYPGKARH